MSKSIQKFYVVSVRGSPARLVTPDANVRQNYLAICTGCRSGGKRQLLSHCRFRSNPDGKVFYSLNHNEGSRRFLGGSLCVAGIADIIADGLCRQRGSAAATEKESFAYFMERARNAAICARVQVAAGSNLPPPTPVVMPCSTAQDTALA